MDDLSLLQQSLPASSTNTSSRSAARPPPPPPPHSLLESIGQLQISSPSIPPSPSPSPSPLQEQVQTLLRTNTELRAVNRHLQERSEAWQQRFQASLRTIEQLEQQRTMACSAVDALEADLRSEVQLSLARRAELEEALRNARADQQRLTTLLEAEHQQQQASEPTVTAVTEGFGGHCRNGWLLARAELEVSGRVIGRGAYGEVRLGTWRGCEVAVKTLHDVLLSDYNRGVFEREMYLYSLLSHPHLVKCFGATPDENNAPLIILERMDCSLRVVLMRAGAIDFNRTVRIASQLASALFYLHNLQPRAVVHRDISSANVLLTSEGDVAKLSDFGSAHFLGLASTACPGASIYAAPESIHGDFSCASDMFSFGVVVLEMCTGEMPDPETRLQRIALLRSENLRSLVQLCLRPLPQERPSARAVLNFLNNLAQRYCNTS